MRWVVTYMKKTRISQRIVEARTEKQAIIKALPPGLRAGAVARRLKEESES